MKKRRSYVPYKKPSKLERFYKSNAWYLARARVIARANGLCEKCGAVGLEVHHKIHLTIHNVDDESISINPDNLIYLCKDCHNKEPYRFGKHSVYQFDKNGNLIAVKSD